MIQSSLPSKAIKNSEKKATDTSHKKSAYGLVIPFVISFIMTILISIIISFTFNFMKIGYSFEFVGFDNYLAIFRDPLFIKSYTNVLVIMARSIPITILLAIYFVVLLNSAQLKGKGLFRTVYYIPTITSAVAVASIFMTFLNPTGLFNGFLNALGINGVQWSTNPFRIRISMIITMIWLSVGYSTILFSAGLQGISKEIYGSTEIGGASKLRQFFLLTIPMLKPIILMATALATINSLGNFNIPNIFFGTSNGPESSTLVVGVNLYKTSFEMVDFGKASTIAWTMVFVSVVLSAIQFKFGGDKND